MYWMDGSKKTNLIGETIRKCEVSQDRNSIVFTTDNKKIAYKTHGGCCSDSWIEHFERDGIEGSTVIDVKNFNIDDDNSKNDLTDLLSTKYPDRQQECDRAYFYEIVTDKGSFTIEMRNSSNGYYGGWLTEEILP